MLHKIYIANKCYSFPTISIFFLFILKTIMFPHTQKWSRTTVFNIHNNKWFWAPNQHIRIISERATCDTEDWSNGCWKFWFAITGIDYVLKYISRKTVMLNCNNLWQGSYRVWKSMEKYEIWFKYFPGLEKYGKKKAKYGKIFVFPDFCSYLVFFIIENSEFNENKFIIQDVRFHGSCLVIL